MFYLISFLLFYYTYQLSFNDFTKIYENTNDVYILNMYIYNFWNPQTQS